MAPLKGLGLGYTTSVYVTSTRITVAPHILETLSHKVIMGSEPRGSSTVAQCSARLTGAYD